MKKEVYSSFEGKLNVDCQNGYIITEIKDFYEVEFLSVWQDIPDKKVRIRKKFLPECDFENYEKICDLTRYIEDGLGDYGQCWYNGKWYGYDLVCKIREKYQVNNWKYGV